MPDYQSVGREREMSFGLSTSGTEPLETPWVQRDPIPWSRTYGEGKPPAQKTHLHFPSVGILPKDASYPRCSLLIPKWKHVTYEVFEIEPHEPFSCDFPLYHEENICI